MSLLPLALSLTLPGPAFLPADCVWTPPLAVLGPALLVAGAAGLVVGGLLVPAGLRLVRWWRGDPGARRHQALAEANIAIFVVAAESGRIVEANRKAAELVGWTQLELIGMDHLRLHPAEEEQAMRERFWERLGVEGFRAADMHLVHRSGERIPVEMLSSMFRAGRRRYVQGIFRDRRGRISMQNELRLSEQRYRLLFEALPAAVFEEDYTEAGAWLEKLRAAGVRDLPGYLVAHGGEVQALFNRLPLTGLNRAALAAAGGTDLLAYTRRVPELVTPEVLRAFVHQLTALWEGRTEAVTEIETLIDRGETGRGLLRWSVGEKNGAPVLGQALTVFVDLSRERAAQERLRVSEDRWALALQVSDNGIWDYDFRTGAAFYSERSRRMLGYDPTEFNPTQKEWTDLIHPEDAPRALEAMKAHLRRETDTYAVEIRMQRKDGGYQWLFSRGKVLFDAQGRPQRALGLHTDIDRRKADELALRASEENYRGLFETAAEGVYRTSADGRLLAANTALARIFNCAGVADLQAWMQPHVAEFYVRPGRREEFIAALGDREEVRDFESEVRCRDGATKWISENVRAVRDAAGRLLHLEGFMTDITARKHADRALRESQARLQQLMEQADCLLWRAHVRTPPEGEWEWRFDIPASGLYRRIFGRDPAPGENWLWNRVETDDLVAMDARCRDALRAGAPGYQQEFLVRVQGAARWLEEKVEITPSGPGEWSLVGVAIDVTARRQAEAAQRESQAQLQQLLGQADCLLWRAQVREQDGALEWRFDVPTSGLYRRIFGRDHQPGSGLLWSAVHSPDLPEMQARSRAALRGGASGYRQEFRVRPVGGSELWLAENVEIAARGAGAWELVGVITDVTAQRQAEAAQRESQARLRQLVSQADCLMWRARVTDEAGRLRWRFELLPSSSRNSLRRLVGEQPPPEKIWREEQLPDLAELDQRGAAALRGGARGYRQEFRVLNAGETFWVAESVEITPLGAGEWELVGVCIDVTESKQAEARYRQLFAVNPLPMWVFDRETLGFLAVNAAAQRHYGYSAEEFARLTLRDIRPPEDVPKLEAAAHTLGDTLLQSGFWRHCKKNGELMLVEVDTHPIIWEGRRASLSLLRDVTEQVGAQTALRESEERYRELFAQAPVATLHMDLSSADAYFVRLRTEGVTDLAARLRLHPEEVEAAVAGFKPVALNEAVQRLFRIKSIEEYVARRAEFYPPTALCAAAAMLAEFWAGRNEFAAELELRDATGERRQCFLRCWVPRGEDGQLALGDTLMALADLTELKRAEAALAAEKERLAVTLRAMTEAVVTFDTGGAVQFMNRAAEALLGCEAARAAGRPVAEVCVLRHEATGEPAPLPAAGVVDQWFDLPAQTVLADRTGALRAVEGRCAPVYDRESRATGWVLVLRDVSETRRLESEMQRASKLESVGLLAGGIAHDFNNILTAIMGNITLAMMDAQAFASAGKWLRAAEQASVRARELTQQLLTFAKGGDPVRASVDLGEIVREAAEFALHGSKVRGDFRISEDLWPAHVDRGQIAQVVQNLVINAVQAMPEGGTITLALENHPVAPPAAGPLAPGDYLLFSITDTGTGIKPDHLAKIFDPYFTTKQTGSGLGLATVYSIVKKHQGHIEVRSALGRGTTFDVWLPTARGLPAAPREPLSPLEAASGRVLFMDDEEPIRLMAQTLLARIGFSVTAAADGAEAVARHAEALAQGRPFDVVVMDLTVAGGMGGRAALEQMRRAQPGVRAIVASGYSSDPVLADHRAHGFAGMVPKPYRIADLVKTIKAVMAEK